MLIEPVAVVVVGVVLGSQVCLIPASFVRADVNKMSVWHPRKTKKQK